MRKYFSGLQLLENGRGETLNLLMIRYFKGNMQFKRANFLFFYLQFGIETEPIPEDIEDPKAYRSELLQNKLNIL